MNRPIIGFHQIDGPVAVQCFYIISGFYMALILNEKYNRPRDYGIFLQQRFLRIYPSYFVILAMTMLVEGLFPRLAFFGCWKAWVDNAHVLTPVSIAVLSLPNLLIFGQDWLYFLAIDPHTGNFFPTAHFGLEAIPCNQFVLGGPSWSLAVELSFYLVAPFLVRRSLLVQGLVILASLGLRIFLSRAFDFTIDPWDYRFFPAQLMFFMAGSIGYAMYRRHEEWLRAFGSSKPWIAWLLWLSLFTYGRIPGSHELRSYIILPIVALLVPLLFAVYKNNRIDRAIGELSYPLYLLQFLVLFVLNPFRPNPMHLDQCIVIWPSPLYTLFCIIVAVGGSWLFYHFIESRFDAYRARLFHRVHDPKTSTSRSST